MSSLLNKSLKGIAITMAATGMQYGIAFAVQLFLARLLTPEIFGLFALISAIVMLFNALAMTQADKYLIREEEDIHTKINALFTFSLCFSIFLALTVIIGAKFILPLFNKQEAFQYTACMTILFLYNPFVLPRALFEKDMSFFKARYPLILSQITGGAGAVFFAYCGYGIWSLIFWRIIQQFTEVLIIWCIAPYRPKISFNFYFFKDFLQFSLPLIGGGVIVYGYWNVDYYIVEYFVGLEQLGYYYFSFQLAHYFLNAKTAVNTVMFPAYVQSPESERANILKQLCDIIGLIYLIPAILLLFFGEPIVSFVFGEKWLPAVPILKIFMVIILIRAVIHNSGPYLYSYGITRMEFTVSALNLVLMFPFIALGCFLGGVVGAACGVLGLAIFTAIYLYTRYIYSHTGKAVWYYFHKPIFAILTGVFFVWLTSSSSLLIQSLSLILCLVIIVAIYWQTFTHVHAFIKNTFSNLKLGNR